MCPSDSQERFELHGPGSARDLRGTARRAAARARGASPGAPGPAAPADRMRAHVGLRALDTSTALSPDSTHGAASSVRPGGGGATKSESAAPSDRDLVGEALVRAAPPGSELVIPPGSRITPLAKELAFQKGVVFTTGRSAEPQGPLRSGALRSLRIALASDHGGFALKDELLPLLAELGHRATDFGPPAASPSVDYPDFAERVAQEVSAGRADVGIVVDGAGIGSAIVANKVPGVFAANCWNDASARNAREHNHANVLTLGAGHLELASARSIVAAFLSTPFGPDRHARRARKTRRIEADHLRPRALDRVFDEQR